MTKETIAYIISYIVINACSKHNHGWEILLKEILKDENIDINACVGFCGTALHIACSFSDFDVVNILLKHKANPNKLDPYNNQQPLCIALIQMDTKIAELLFQYGAKIDINRRYDYETLLIILPHISYREKNTILRHITYYSHMEDYSSIRAIELLLKEGADPEFCDESERGEYKDSALRFVERENKSKLLALFTHHIAKIQKSTQEIDLPTANSIDNHAEIPTTISLQSEESEDSNMHKSNDQMENSLPSIQSDGIQLSLKAASSNQALDLINPSNTQSLSTANLIETHEVPKSLYQQNVNSKKYSIIQKQYLGMPSTRVLIIAACAVVGALAFYFFVSPIILGAVASLSAKLVVGVAGAAAGGLI